MKAIILTLCLFIFLMTAQNCFAQQTLYFAGVENPPYLIKGNEKQLNAGLFHQQLVELFSKSDGLEFEIIEYPQERATLSLINNDISGIVASGRTPLEQLYLDYISLKFSFQYYIYTHKSAFPVGLNIESRSELLNYEIGVVRGEKYDANIDELVTNNYIENHKVSKSDQKFLMLSSGRVDFIIAEEKNANFLLDKLGIKGNISRSASPLFEKPVYLLAFSKFANHKTLVKKLNQQVIDN